MSNQAPIADGSAQLTAEHIFATIPVNACEFIEGDIALIDTFLRFLSTKQSIHVRLYDHEKQKVLYSVVTTEQIPSIIGDLRTINGLSTLSDSSNQTGANIPWDTFSGVSFAKVIEHSHQAKLPKTAHFVFTPKTMSEEQQDDLCASISGIASKVDDRTQFSVHIIDRIKNEEESKTFRATIDGIDPDIVAVTSMSDMQKMVAENAATALPALVHKTFTA
ncbi:MAG: hypothetical protein ABW189_08585 [Rickettsiales bacterium]